MKRFLHLFLMIPFLTYGQWNQMGGDIDGEAEQDTSGSAISLSNDGTILAIGANQNDGSGSQNSTLNIGHVRIYEWNGTSWIQKGADIDGEAIFDTSGVAVDLNGDGTILAIGAEANEDNGSFAGHVRVYEWNGSSWAQKGVDLDGEAAGDRFGRSVSLSNDGNILAIGGYSNDGGGTDAGHVRVYEWNGSSWTQKGSDIDGEAASDFFGFYTSINSDGNILAIGAYGNDGTGSNAGHVRVYEWDGSNWAQKGSDIDGEAASDFSGECSLNGDGTILAIGAFNNDGNGTDSGHVRVYEWNGFSWAQKGSDIDGSAADDRFGRSVSLNGDGSILAAGAYLNDGNVTDAGHVRVFEWSGSSWNQIGADIEGETFNDYSGIDTTLSVDGSILAIGAHYNDGNGTQSGHVRVYNNPSLDIRDDEFTQIRAYPVPSSSDVNIDLGQVYSEINVLVVDMLGKEVMKRTYSNTSKLTVGTSKITAGTYLVKIVTDSKESSLRILVN